MRLILLTEFEEVMGYMATSMNPGLDGFTVNLFHAFWELVKDEVWKIVEDSRKTQHILPALNANSLSLIHKSGEVVSL